MSVNFADARPVWIRGRHDEWNQAAGFVLAWSAGDNIRNVILRVTGADCYRIHCNGEYAGHGPARAAHGHARVDEWPIGRFISSGVNRVAIEVHSYGVDSYAYILQKPFLQAEVVADGQVVASTSESTKAFSLSCRIQKIERFSKQRPMAEAYQLTAGCDDWRIGEYPGDAVRCTEVQCPQLLPRGVRLPGFNCIDDPQVLEWGTVTRRDPAPALPRSAREMIGKRVMGFAVDELQVDMMVDLNAMEFCPDACVNRFIEEVCCGRGAPVTASGYALYDFGAVQGGFIGGRLSCEERTRVYLHFDELRDRGEGKMFTLGLGAVYLDLQPGTHDFESMEPYTFRFMRVIAMDAAVKVERLYVREYAHPKCDEAVLPDDPQLAKIMRAARQTFRTNSIDLFTDCMSRERGGYPCDSWFTARAERVFAGESLVERNFLENYFLADRFAAIPDGMVPHCYPSDRLGEGQYIPNWGLWLVYQLCDYLGRNDDSALLELARPRVEALFKWFEPSINELGLLEDLPGWIFVEWSKANDVTDAVNYPTNMLYAAALDMASQVFGRNDWKELAGRAKSSIFRESWDGRWFADQSVRVQGNLTRSEVRTETCQYHALYFGLAECGDCGDLWARLRDGYGARPQLSGVAQGGLDGGELEPAGLLYGLMLRFDLMERYGDWQALLEEVRLVFGRQADLTGTLWEHLGPQSSCNHGFASCAAEYIVRALAAVNAGPKA